MEKIAEYMLYSFKKEGSREKWMTKNIEVRLCTKTLSVIT